MKERIIFHVFIMAILSGCIVAQPNNIDNICSIFGEKRNWYDSAQATEDRWGIPIAVNMAVIVLLLSIVFVRGFVDPEASPSQPVKM